MRIDFTRRQWRIFLGCFICYTTTYIARLNLPAALNSLASDMALTGAQGGLLQTAFALVYACGQLVNGAMVDRVSARRHIAIGLGLSAVCNLLFALATQYWMLLVLWALNGAVQSMIWTPVVRLIATWFRGRRRRQASFGITLTLILGNLCAWMVSGYVASVAGWRWSFILPAAWTILVAGISWLMLRDRPEPGEDLGEDGAARDSAAEGGTISVRSVLLTTGLIPLLVCCIGDGFVRDGIITWAPTIIARLNRQGTLDTTLTSLLIPLLNLIGVLLAGRIYARFHESGRRCVGFLMLLSAALALLLIPAMGGAWVCALLLGLCCSTTNGVNPMLTTFIPMEYERVGRVGLVAGMMDSLIYVGSALTGVVSGAVSDASGWRPVFILWCAAAIASAAAAFLSMKGAHRLGEERGR